MYIVLNFESSYLNLKSCFEVFSLGHGVQDSRTTNFIHQNEGLSPVQLLLVLAASPSAALTIPKLSLFSNNVVVCSCFIWVSPTVWTTRSGPWHGVSNGFSSPSCPPWPISGSPSQTHALSSAGPVAYGSEPSTSAWTSRPTGSSHPFKIKNATIIIIEQLFHL